MPRSLQRTFVSRVLKVGKKLVYKRYICMYIMEIAVIVVITYLTTESTLSHRIFIKYICVNVSNNIANKMPISISIYFYIFYNQLQVLF